MLEQLRRTNLLQTPILARLSTHVGLVAALATLGATVMLVLAIAVLRWSDLALLVGLLISAAGAAGLAAYLLTERLTAPLTRLSGAALRMAIGDLSTPIQTDGPPEIVNLARSLENARHELEGMTRWLTHEKAWAEYLVDSIVEGILTLDAAGRVTFANRAALSLLGCASRDVIGKPINDLLKPTENAELPGQNLMFDQLLPGAGVERTIPVTRGDGQPLTLSVTGARLKPPVESNARVALVFRDVTAETAVQRLQGYFLANVSHELQTPLASLRTSAELLVTEQDDLSSDEHHRLHTTIYRGILRLEALVDNLLAGASVQAGRFTIKPASIDLAEPVEDAMLFMGPLIDAAGLSLDVSLPDVLLTVNADSRRVTQVLVNLLSNAVKYAPRGSPVQLSVVPHFHVARVEVRDRGPGIPPEARELIFNRFSRLNNPTARKEPGTGLGLYIARTIIESHGGAMGVDSPPGGGTIFWFTLPMEAA